MNRDSRSKRTPPQLPLSDLSSSSSSSSLKIPPPSLSMENETTLEEEQEFLRKAENMREEAESDFGGAEGESEGKEKAEVEKEKFIDEPGSTINRSLVFMKERVIPAHPLDSTSVV
jgi:hypothetical protein